MRFLEERNELVLFGRKLSEKQLNQGTSGNLSLRVDGGFLVTPTAVAVDAMAPEDLVFMNLEGDVGSGGGRPSSEWRIHRDLYAARPDFGAIVHAHSMFCTTLSMVRKAIPAVHYMVAVAGGNDIRCAPYATFGSQQLSDGVVEAMSDRKACLMANHGMVSAAATLPEAFAIAVEVETLAAQYWRALQVGEPHVLSDAQMDDVRESLRRRG